MRVLGMRLRNGQAMVGCHWFGWIAILLLLCLSMTQAFAQSSDVPFPQSEAEKKINAAKVVSPLKSNLFGESISLYDGATSFSVTDIDIPGNNSLPVRISRTLKIEDRHWQEYLPGFSDWEIDLPRIEGVFAASQGWKIPGSSPYARCTVPSIPDITTSGVATSAYDVWHGNQLIIPGAGEQEMLIDDAAKTPTITDGKDYPWVTAKFWRIRCLATTANGYPGEAFVALSPDGTIYTMDYVVTLSTTDVMGVSTLNPNPPVHVGRVRVAFLATRVEDRFGNYVTYSYSNGRLSGITSSDGRTIGPLTYTNGLITSIAANGKTWGYGYEPVANPTQLEYTSTLSEVTLPDTSTWTYSATGALLPKKHYEDPHNGPHLCPLEADARDDDAGYHLTAKSPSGATGVFDFWYRRIRRTHTPMSQCYAGVGADVPTPYVSHYSDVYSIYRKAISGPGLTTQTWDYSIPDGSYHLYTNPTEEATDACPTCAQSKTVIVAGSDGQYDAYTFGIVFGNNEGQLLEVDHGSGSDDPLSTTTTQYLLNTEVAAQQFPDAPGSSMNLPYSPAIHLRPVVKTTIVQDGATFKNEVGKSGSVYAFDAFARPLTVTKSSSAYVAPTAPTTAPTATVPATSQDGDYIVTWSAISGATSYRLEERIGTGSWSVIYSGGGRSYSFSDKPNGAYSYRVSACNAGGCGPVSATASIVVGLTPVGAPTLNMSTSQSTPSVSVTWTAVTNATNYVPEQSANGTSGWTSLGTYTGTSATATQPTATTYYYRVKACNSYGCSPYSAVRSVYYEKDHCPTCRGVGGDFRFEPMRQVVANAH